MSGAWARRAWPLSAGTPSAPPCWQANSSWRPESPMGWCSGGWPARKGDRDPSMTTLELIASFLGAIITLMVLSYLFADNPLFRLAIHIFIGSASGYAGAIAWHNVLKPGLVDPRFAAGVRRVTQTSALVTVVLPWILVLVLLLKLSPRTARYGTLSMALLVGGGAAVVVGGAVRGTLR